MVRRVFAIIATILVCHVTRLWREYLALSIVTCLVAIISYVTFFTAPATFPKGEVVRIVAGAALDDIARELREAGLIKNATAFKIAIHLTGDARTIHAGAFRFEEPVSAFVVAERLLAGESGIVPVTVTLPEGFTSAEMGLRIASEVSPELGADFMRHAARHEGYLFPDTYRISEAESTERLVRRMRENFDAKFAPLEAARVASKYTLGQVVGLASLLEGEANNEKDMKMVAGILWSRLKINMPLQVDVAPITYKERGIPRPINNPGLTALRAALSPIKSPYLFYLTGKDGSMYYAKTFAEHERNIERHLR